MERLVGLSSLLYTTTFRFNKWNLLLCAFRDYNNWIERLLCACVVQIVTLLTYFFQYPTVYLVQYELSSYSVN